MPRIASLLIGLTCFWVVGAHVPSRAAGTCCAGGNVLVIGDSLTVGAAPSLMSLLDRRGRYDALNGRNSTVALARLKALLTPHDSVVVFAVGTNDDPAHPKVLQDNLRRARSIAGRRCLVLATLSRPPVNNHSYEGLNRVIVRFASRDSRTVTFDWRRYARTHPERMASDQVHADPAGYRARAQQAYRATRACLVK